MSYTIIMIIFILTVTLIGMLNVHRKLVGPNEIQSGTLYTIRNVNHHVLCPMRRNVAASVPETFPICVPLLSRTEAKSASPLTTLSAKR